MSKTILLAHVLKTDHDVGAVLHVEPNENPKVGQPAYFYLDFKDRENCDCRVTLLQDSKTIYSTLIKEPYFDFIFDEPGNYQLEVKGDPSFNLHYDVRVSPSTEPKVINDSGYTFTLAIVLIIGLAIAFQVARIVRSRR